MRTIAIIFEDHKITSFRPLAWSVPLYELRCGMFNTRERLSQILQARSDKKYADQHKFGGLLNRSLFADFEAPHCWEVSEGPITELTNNTEFGYLWINARILPSFSLLEKIVHAADQQEHFEIYDENGLVAAAVNSEKCCQMLNSWKKWEKQQDLEEIWTSSPQPAAFWPLTTKLPANRGWKLFGAEDLLDAWLEAEFGRQSNLTLGWIWEIVPATGSAIVDDIAFTGNKTSFVREPFGIRASADQNNAVWLKETRLESYDTIEVCTAQACDISEPGNCWIGQDVKIAPQVVIDSTAGPVVIDNAVTIQAHSFLEGPLYIGPGSIVKAGARIYGETSLGIANRVAGEIGESTFADFSNKQHTGFIGHAVLGSWVNLGALTTCSDLKNNYGNVRVDLGLGSIDTELRFVGLMVADHVKVAIGTMFNTGTVVGFATNIFGGVMPPKYVSGFRWGGQPGCPDYAVEKAIETAAIVMQRRGCQFCAEHEQLFKRLYLS